MANEHWLVEVRVMHVADASADWELVGMDKECGIGTYVRNRLIATNDLNTALLSFMIHVNKRESDRPGNDAFTIPAVSGHSTLQFLYSLYEHFMGLMATGLLDVSPVKSPSPATLNTVQPAPDTSFNDLDREMNELYRRYKEGQNGLSDSRG